MNARNILFGFFFSLAVPTVAFACPDWRAGSGESLPGSATALRAGVMTAAVAGGDRDLGDCPRLPGHGWVARSADFTADLRPAPGDALVFEAFGTCDVVLLINTGNGNWYFDDDNGRSRGGDARIVLRQPSSGIYDVWVGTFGSRLCNASLGITAAPRATAGQVSFTR